MQCIGRKSRHALKPLLNLAYGTNKSKNTRASKTLAYFNLPFIIEYHLHIIIDCIYVVSYGNILGIHPHFLKSNSYSVQSAICTARYPAPSFDSWVAWDESCLPLLQQAFSLEVSIHSPSRVAALRRVD